MMLAATEAIAFAQTADIMKAVFAATMQAADIRAVFTILRPIAVGIIASDFKTKTKSSGFPLLFILYRLIYNTREGAL